MGKGGVFEPDYNCPECDYHKTGASTSPHDFKDHLIEQHDYSEDEARDVLHS